MSDIVLEMHNISKSFPGVQALDNVSLKARKGKVHALMGENGAGKSTLMNCLFGIHQRDSGRIFLDGEEVSFDNPREAIDNGISMVAQELNPIPMMTIAENIYLGKYPTKNGLVDHKKMNEETKQYLDIVGLHVDPRTLMNDLTISEQQSVEIAKALSHQAKIIIMDEPTSSLTIAEVDKLFEVIDTLCKRGIAVIYISHKMDEIYEIADDLTVLRDGKNVNSYKMEDVTPAQIVHDMVGRELDNQYPDRVDQSTDEVMLEVKNFTSPDPLSFKDCSFHLQKGEILGVAGLIGAQRTELMEAIFGLREHVEGGKIYISGKEVEIDNPRDAIRNNIALVTEDRRESGIFGVLPVGDNITIASLHRYLNSMGLLDKGEMNKVVDESIEQLNIKTPSPKTHIANLSGGNQQKVIIARWLATTPDILILDEPTRGIDVGAKYEIYEIINSLAKAGKSIIMISSELPELLGVANRIIVMCEGRISGELGIEEATQEKIMTLATAFMDKSQDNEANAVKSEDN